MHLPCRGISLLTGKMQNLTRSQILKQIKIIIIKMLKIGFPYSYDFESVL